jgi:hypothetical protein
MSMTPKKRTSVFDEFGTPPWKSWKRECEGFGHMDGELGGSAPSLRWMPKRKLWSFNFNLTVAGCPASLLEQLGLQRGHDAELALVEIVVFQRNAVSRISIGVLRLTVPVPAVSVRASLCSLQRGMTNVPAAEAGVAGVWAASGATEPLAGSAPDSAFDHAVAASADLVALSPLGAFSNTAITTTHLRQEGPAHVRNLCSTL